MRTSGAVKCPAASSQIEMSEGALAPRAAPNGMVKPAWHLSLSRQPATSAAIQFLAAAKRIARLRSNDVEDMRAHSRGAISPEFCNLLSLS